MSGKRIGLGDPGRGGEAAGAAERLGIGVRQIKRLARRYRERGAAGLVSGHRGKRPNNAIDAAVRREVVDLVRKRYRDFGPTFAREKLVEVHGLRLSAETLRKWMIADGLWRAKTRREVRTHQSRPRRECVGDLVQIDGSATVLREGRELPVRLLAEGEEPIPLEDGKNRARARRRGEGGAAGAAGLQAAAGPSLAATVQARRERGGGRMKPRAPADALWICGRVPRTGARPSGRVDSPWTTRSAESPSTGRFRRALPTGCPHSRASRPQPHSSATKFFFSKKRKARTAKRGHFCFALTQNARTYPTQSSLDPTPGERYKVSVVLSLVGRAGCWPPWSNMSSCCGFRLD